MTIYPRLKENEKALTQSLFIKMNVNISLFSYVLVGLVIHILNE